MLSGRRRYLQYQYLVLAKKKVVHEWKTDLLREKNKNNEDALLSEVLANKETLDDIHMPGSPSKEEPDRASSESERKAARDRIAKWKADRARKMEQEEVNTQKSAVLRTLLTVCCVSRRRSG